MPTIILKARPRRRKISGKARVKVVYEDVLADQMIGAGLPAPVRELRFAPPRRWRFDLAIEPLKLAIEIDGGLFIPGGGRHNRPITMEKDFYKGHAATERGWRVLHFSPRMVASGEAVEVIVKVVSALQKSCNKKS